MLQLSHATFAARPLEYDKGNPTTHPGIISHPPQISCIPPKNPPYTHIDGQFLVPSDAVGDAHELELINATALILRLHNHSWFPVELHKHHSRRHCQDQAKPGGRQ